MNTINRPRESADWHSVAQVGHNVSISIDARLYGDPANVRLGSNIRIDDFTIIVATGPLVLGNYVHLSPFSLLNAGGGITMADFSSLAARCQILSCGDDFSGDWMTNPTVPAKYRRSDSAPIYIGRHVVIGSGAIVLPGTTIGDGHIVGAHSLVNGDWPSFGQGNDAHILAGVPAHVIKARKARFWALANELLEDIAGKDAEAILATTR